MRLPTEIIRTRVETSDKNPNHVDKISQAARNNNEEQSVDLG